MSDENKTEKLKDLFTEVTGEDTVTEEQENDERRGQEGENDGRALPTQDVKCDDCGNDTAYYYLQQTRAADESETRFFICTECENKWRDYD